jgi:hypothetical protein
MTYNTQNSIYCSPVNNTGVDPLQGFDAEAWVLDVCTGKLAWFGKFQSITYTIRNATETYLELGQRIPIYLDGEIQVAWVLEQGMVDINFIERTFGVPTLRRDSYITRGPRFQISFDVNSPELNYANTLTGDGTMNRSVNQPTAGSYTKAGEIAQTVGKQSLYRYGSDEYFQPAIGVAGVPGNYSAHAQGRIDLMRCKVDSVSMGAMPGRRVIALRWEGVSEGVTFVPETVQKFKTDRFTKYGATGGGFVQNRSAGSYNEDFFKLYQ